MQPHPIYTIYTINPVNTVNPVKPLQTSGFEGLRTQAPDLARHGAKVVLFCTAIALFFWLARPSQKWDIQLVYSLATGITSWLLIDGSRFFINRALPFGFPRGWRGVALIFMGVPIGFVVGTLAGDTYSGRSTFELLPNQPRLFLYLFLFTMSIGTGIIAAFIVHCRIGSSESRKSSTARA